jgi:hypothetical protein
MPAERDAREPVPRATCTTLALLGPGYFADAKFRDDSYNMAPMPPSTESSAPVT